VSSEPPEGRKPAGAGPEVSGSAVLNAGA